jgi:hypothetical protein
MTRAELQQHHIERHGRDYSVSDDGYGDMEANAAHGWIAVPGWGRDGWDLGDWPFVAISVRNVNVDGSNPEHRYQLLSVVEGDHDAYGFASQEDRNAAVDYLFLWYGIGKCYDDWTALGVNEVWEDGALVRDTRALLDAGELAVDARLRGAFSWERLAREQRQQHGICEVCEQPISDDEHAKLETDIDFVEHGPREERHAIRRKRVWCLKHEVPYEPQDKHAENSPLSCPVCDAVDAIENPKPDLEES